MKKQLLTVALLASSLVASAQFAVGNSGNSLGSTVSGEGWNGFRFSYVPTTLEFDDANDDLDFTGFSFEYVKGFGIMDNMPLFLEFGVGFEWLNWNDKEEDVEDDWSMTYKTATNITSLYVPVNIGYKFALNDNISIMPYVGLKARFNITATESSSYEIDGPGSEYDESEDNSYSLFDEDEMGDYTMKRFLIGWQIGATATYDNFTFGVNYGSYFASEIMNKIDSKLSATAITIGYNF